MPLRIAIRTNINFRGTKDFTLAVSTSQRAFSATGWNVILTGRLPGFPAIRDKCSAVNTTFTINQGGRPYRFFKFVAHTHMVGSAALEYIGLFE